MDRDPREPKSAGRLGSVVRPAFQNRWTYIYTVAAVLTALNLGHIVRDAGESLSKAGLVAGLGLVLVKVCWAWLQTLLAVAVGSFNRVVLRWWSALLILATSGAAYYTFRMRLPIDRAVLHAVLVTDQAEVTELVDPYLILVVLLVGFPLAWLALKATMGPQFFVPWRIKSWTTAPLAWSLAILSVLGIVHLALRMEAVGSGYDAARRHVAPFNVVISGGELSAQLWRSRVVKVRDLRPEFAAAPAMTSDSDPEVVVIVIGESARSANFGLAGYERDTTPRLAKEQNLAVFSDVTACRTMTAYSVPCLMSRSTIAEFSLPLRETSVVGILHGMGYDTHWYATQGSMRSEPIMRLCREAGVCKVGIVDADNRDYDGLLVPYVQKAIEAPKAARKVIVLHTRGSHFVYHYRHPREFARYTPECTGPSFGCDRASVINSYDNSILYTDHVLAEIIALLRDRKAALFYTPDHGESLGEKLFFGHGTPSLLAPREQLQVPIMIWLSDRFQRDRGIRIDGIKRPTGGSPVTHDHFFHTVLGCLGATSKLLDPALDLCRAGR